MPLHSPYTTIISLRLAHLGTVNPVCIPTEDNEQKHLKSLSEELILASHSHIVLYSHVQISNEMRQGLLVAMSTHVVARITVSSLLF